jgi:hypothetical protein
MKQEDAKIILKTYIALSKLKESQNKLRQTILTGINQLEQTIITK